MRFVKLTGALILLICAFWSASISANPLDWNLDAELFSRYEGQEIAAIDFIGLNQSETADLRAAVEGLFGQPTGKSIFRFESLVQVRQLINEYFRGRGFVYAHLGSIDFRDGTLKLVIWRRKIEKILYRGRLASAAVARFLGIKIGAEYNLHIIERQSQKLYRNPDFQNIDKVSITPYLKKEDALIVELNVHEKTKSDFSLRTNTTPLRGVDAELDFKLKEFYNTDNTFHARLRGISSFNQFRYVGPKLGLSDFDNPDEKNPLRYHLFVSAEIQSKQKVTSDLNKQYTLPKTQTAGIDLALYLLKRDSTFRSLSRFLGFHNAGLTSRMQAQVYPGSYGEYTIGIGMDDTDYVILPYMASRFAFKGGVGDGLGDAQAVWLLSLDYFVPLYARQHLRIDFQYGTGRAPELLNLANAEPQVGHLIQRFYLPNYGLFGLRYYFDVYELLFMGPTVHYVYLPDEPGISRLQNNWASLGWGLSYNWSSLELNGGVSYAFAGVQGEWSGGLWSVYYF